MTLDTERDAARFLTRIARALHVHGMPAHRLEEALAALSEKLGLEAQWLVTPTSIVASLGPFERSHTYLVRVDPGEADLTKLAELHGLIRDVEDGSIPLADAIDEVEAIVAEVRGSDPWITAASFGVVSASAAAFFDGGAPEVGVAAAIGIGIAFLSRLAGRYPRLGLIAPAVGGVFASAVAHLAVGVAGELYPFIPTLAGLIVLLPGLTLTLAVSELAHRHLVSGSARLVGAFMTFLQIGFGVALGSQGAHLFVPGLESTPPEPFPWPATAVALVTASVALSVLFRARSSDIPSILAAIATAYVAARAGGHWLGPELGALAGAVALGLVSNAISRIRDVPAATPLLPGLIVLVPGSIGFRSLSALLSDDVVGGLSSGFSAIVIALSLVTGLLVANLVTRPRELF